MNKNPQLRPSATEILQDPFIKTHLQVSMSLCAHLCVCVCARVVACFRVSVHMYMG